MQIRHVIIKVDDQEKALAFYTSVLGFEKNLDMQAGGVRWLTVRSPEGAEGGELVLEPNHWPPARASQETLYEAGFPAAVVTTDDLEAECRRLRELGVEFRGEPKALEHNVSIPFDDTCGNFIMLVEPVT
jgi:catechol 2,3-dioxygenase-like lactoylglutathione lyase family enzyme